MLSPNFQTRARYFKFLSRNSRGSVITPVNAEAATVAGDPMNTSRARVAHAAFEVARGGGDADSRPGRSRPCGRRRRRRRSAGVIIAPASTSFSIAPALSASRYTRCDAGVTIKRTPGATRLPATTRAASSRSSSVPFAHEPMYAWSIFCAVASLHRHRSSRPRVGKCDERLERAQDRLARTAYSASPSAYSGSNFATRSAART